MRERGVLQCVLWCQTEGTRASAVLKNLKFQWKKKRKKNNNLRRLPLDLRVLAALDEAARKRLLSIVRDSLLQRETRTKVIRSVIREVSESSTCVSRGEGTRD